VRTIREGRSKGPRETKYLEAGDGKNRALLTFTGKESRGFLGRVLLEAGIYGKNHRKGPRNLTVIAPGKEEKVE